MCGIHFTIGPSPVEPSEEVLQLLSERGPDHIHTCQRTIERTQSGGAVSTVYATFTASVLSLMGQELVKQPLQDDDGSLMCWNGEAWKLDEEPITQNDGAVVFDALSRSSRAECGRVGRNCEEDECRGRAAAGVISVLASISGPYAFAFYDANHRILYFGRDLLGRRSLMTQQEGGALICSSVSTNNNRTWQETPAGEVQVLDLNQPTSNLFKGDHQVTKSMAIPYSFPSVNAALPPPFQASAEDTSGTLISAATELEHHLLASLRLRTRSCTLGPLKPESLSAVRVAILFSGGLDCTLLAYLAHTLHPADNPIDLLNVAFANPRLARKLASDERENLLYEACPDRILGRRSLLELQRTCPGRRWNFVCIDLPYAEVLAHKKEVIRLMAPHATEMDLSIALPFYFAARGQGHIIPHSTEDSHDEEPQPQAYTTPSRVLISGLGADELFGGYTRHATALARGGYPALVAELQSDFDRLGARNLGRDDRVLSRWAKEVRYPFLDERLVAWALDLPVWFKCVAPNQAQTGSKGGEDGAQGLPVTKRVLRVLARVKGLVAVAAEPKRAIQFGSRSAKMDKGRSKGTDLVEIVT